MLGTLVTSKDRIFVTICGLYIETPFCPKYETDHVKYILITAPDTDSYNVKQR